MRVTRGCAARRVRTGLLILALICGLTAPSGCKRKEDPGKQGQAAARAPARQPVFEIAPSLTDEFGEVAAFIRRFLATCSAGDYAGYRTLVGRRFTPQPQERFTAMYEALEAVAVESIERVDVPELGGEAYVVVSQVSLDPAKRVALRGANRRLVIIVFREGGEWRMGPVPRGLRPEAPEPRPGGPGEDGAATHFPWDVDEPP